MKRQWIQLVGIAVMFLLMAAGCSTGAIQLLATPAPDSAESTTFPIGIFMNNGWAWEFKDDGTYYAYSGDEDENGIYIVSGDQIMIQGDYCEDVKGSYTWTYDGQNLSFEVIDDQCTESKNSIVFGEYSKQP